MAEDMNKDFNKVAEIIFDTLNDPNNPFRLLVESMKGYWVNQGFDPDQANFLVCRELGWHPPKSWRVTEENDE